MTQPRPQRTSPVAFLRCFFLSVVILFSLFAFIPSILAADIEAVTDSADGSSAFSVKNSANVEQAHVDSIGNIVAKGCVRIDNGLVECSQPEGLVVDGNVGIGTYNPVAKLQVTGGLVRFGSGGAVNYVSGDGDVFVRGDLEAAGDIFGAKIFASGNLGVGTTSPQALVQVTGGDVVIGTGTFTNTSAAPDLYVTGNLEVDGTIYGDGSGITVLPSTLAAGGWVDGGNNVYQTSTSDRVGIGTTTPATTLEIVRQGANAPLMISSTPAGTGDLFIIADAGRVGIGTTAGNAGLTVMTGNVGVGTWSPTGSLEVKGGSAVRIWTGAGTDTNAAGPGELYVEGDLEVDGTIYGDGSGITALPTALPAGGWTDGGANIYQTSTTDNVGIGTTTPATTFEIVRTLNRAPFMISSFATGAGDVVVVTSSGNIGVGTVTPAGALTVMTGNVGIGTASPVGTLEVRATSAVRIWTGSGTDTNATGPGELYVEGDLEVDGTIYGDGSGITALPSTLAAGGWTDGGTNVYQTSTADNVGIGTTSPSSTLEIVKNAGVSPLMVSSSAIADGDYLIVTTSGNIGIGTTADAGALAVMNGNVGIGTWAPTAKLQVSGTLEATAFVGDGAAITGIIAGGGWTDGGTNVFTTATSDAVGVGTTTPAATLSVENAGAGDSLRVNDAPLDATPFVIGPSGNVGVGTSVPGSLLSVAGGASIGSSPAYSAGVTPADGLVVQGQVGVGTTTPVGGLVIMNGNLGVGTWSPVGALEVRAPNASRIWTGSGTDTNATGPGELYVEGDLEVDGTIYGDGSGITALPSTLAAGGWTDGGTNVYQTSTSDNVGIGTTSPATTLEIVKSLNRPPLMISSTAGATGDYLTVNSSGNIGIGTALPSATLALKGTLTVEPSTVTNITAAGGITVSRGAMRIQGAGGPVTISANPQIVAGSDGEIVILQGSSDVNTVQIQNGNGLRLQGGVAFTLGAGDTITMSYDGASAVWSEISRSDN